MTRKSRITGSHSWTPEIGEMPGNTIYYNDTEYVDGIFSRPYPTPLTNTALSGVRERYNPSSYSDSFGAGRKNLPASLLNGGYKSTRADPGSDDLLAASQRAGSRFYDDLDLGEALGSFRETARMVKDGVESTLGFYRDVRKLGLQSAMRARDLDPKGLSNTKQASSAYLQTQFGWMQLASDAYNAVNGSLTRSVAGTRVQGRGNSVSSQNTNVLGKGQASVRVFLSGNVGNANLRDLNRLGLANPARTAWQLTRLSFVADWWLGLADSLGYYTWSLGLTNTQQSVVSSYVTETQYKSIDPGSDWVSWRTRTIWTRTTSSVSTPWRGLVRTNGEMNLNLGKAITAAALLRQMV